jgi:hypothetical protein
LRYYKWNKVIPQGDQFEFFDDKKIILLSRPVSSTSETLINLGNAIGHSPFMMSTSFTNQQLAWALVGASGADQVGPTNADHFAAIFVWSVSLGARSAALALILRRLFAPRATPAVRNFA